jgi:hypothetical protein
VGELEKGSEVEEAELGNKETLLRGGTLALLLVVTILLLILLLLLSGYPFNQYM